MEPIEEKHDHKEYHSHMMMKVGALIFGLAIIAVVLTGIGAATHSHGEFGYRGGYGMMGAHALSYRTDSNFDAGGSVRSRGGHHGMMQAETVGKITAIAGTSVTIDASGTLTKVTVATDTSLYKSDGTIAALADLKVGDTLSVFGRPGSDGAIQARMIRIQ